MPNPEHLPEDQYINPGDRISISPEEALAMWEDLKKSAKAEDLPVDMKIIEEAIGTWKNNIAKSQNRTESSVLDSQESKRIETNTTSRLGSAAVRPTVSFDRDTNPNVIMFGPEDDTIVMPPKDSEPK